MTLPFTLLLAVAAGAAIANLYYAQPLLDDIAREFGVSHGAAGTLVTATQVGYALGILLFAPLGDILNRRRLVPLALVVSSVALAGAALSPNVLVLGVSLGVMGLTTVAGQIVVPLAGDLADDRSRGRTIGTVASGIIIGILISRVLSGVVAGLLGWRAIFWIAAGLMVVLAALLLVRIPTLAPKERIPYRRLIASMFRMVVTEPVLRLSMAFGSLAFAMFSMFWTALTFLLSSPPFDYPATLIGLFGVVGLVGAAAAQGAGRVHDRGFSRPLMGLFWGVLVIAWVVAALGTTWVVPIVVAVVLLDLGMQGQMLLNQTRLFAAFPLARARVNTAFVTGNFIGGAIGSGLASLLWTLGGWLPVAAAGLVLAIAGLVLWVATRRRLGAPDPVTARG
jgi:predicted MFS family arabinose efflux permease